MHSEASSLPDIGIRSAAWRHAWNKQQLGLSCWANYISIEAKTALSLQMVDKSEADTPCRLLPTEARVWQSRGIRTFPLRNDG